MKIRQCIFVPRAPPWNLFRKLCFKMFLSNIVGRSATPPDCPGKKLSATCFESGKCNYLENPPARFAPVDFRRKRSKLRNIHLSKIIIMHSCILIYFAIIYLFKFIIFSNITRVADAPRRSWGHVCETFSRKKFMGFLFNSGHVKWSSRRPLREAPSHDI